MNEQTVGSEEDRFMTALGELRPGDHWLLFINVGFSMETAKSLHDKGLIETSLQMGMPAARLKRQRDPTTVDAFLDAIFDAFRMHSSPTIDHSDSHGERGQSGMIIWKSSHGFIRQAIADAILDVGLHAVVEVLEEFEDADAASRTGEPE